MHLLSPLHCLYLTIVAIVPCYTQLTVEYLGEIKFQDWTYCIHCSVMVPEFMVLEFIGLLRATYSFMNV